MKAEMQSTALGAVWFLGSMAVWDRVCFWCRPTRTPAMWCTPLLEPRLRSWRLGLSVAVCTIVSAVGVFGGVRALM
jgi:hypothetical protein